MSFFNMKTFTKIFYENFGIFREDLIKYFLMITSVQKKMQN